MNLFDVLDSLPQRKFKKRVGRGVGSGHGRTACRGQKGQKARTSWAGMGLLEGGQMPLFRRLPHRGFNNARFRGDRYSVVNVGQLEARFPAGARVDLAALQAAGVLRKNARLLKVLGTGSLTKKLQVVAHAVSGAARAKIEAAAGSVEEAK